MLWETGHSLKVKQTIQHCSYEGTDCYEAKTVPVIYGISSNIGYTSGGQNLTVRGHGLNHENIDVKIDGVDCKVSQYAEESFSCEVQQKDAPSATDVPQIGQHGLRRRFYNGTTSDHVRNY